MRFEDVIRRFLGSEHVFLFSRGRVGLYAALRCMGLGAGDDVLMPGYTCMVVPTAAMILGIRPVYADIDPATQNVTAQTLEQSVTPNTKAVIVQHTHGIPCGMDPILEWSRGRGLPVIEDCCLAFGSRYKGALCGTFGAAAYFSGQWNKPFSTGLGGMLTVRDGALAQKIRDLTERELIRPGAGRRLLIVLQIALHEWLVTPRTVQRVQAAYRWLSKRNLAAGSSTREEYAGRVPADYFMGMTPEQARKGAREMERLGDNIAHRKRLAAYYGDQLPAAGFGAARLPAGFDPVYVRYPVRVANKREVLQAARREGVEIGSWFESPLHPEGTDLEAFGYRPGQCPEAERAARETVNLPTHRKTPPSEAERLMDFVKKHAKPAG